MQFVTSSARWACPSAWCPRRERTTAAECSTACRACTTPRVQVLIAKLCSMDLSSQRLPRSDALTRVRALVDQRHHACEQRERCFGRMEGLLSRHWPESFQWMDLRLQRTAARLLMTFPGPARVQAEPVRVAALLRASSCGPIGSPEREQPRLVRMQRAGVLAARLMAPWGGRESALASGRWPGTLGAALGCERRGRVLVRE